MKDLVFYSLTKKHLAATNPYLHSKCDLPVKLSYYHLYSVELQSCLKVTCKSLCCFSDKLFIKWFTLVSNSPGNSFPLRILVQSPSPRLFFIQFHLYSASSHSFCINEKELLHQEVHCMHALPIFLCLFISLSIYISTQNKQVVVIFSYRSVNSLIYFYVYLPISLSTFYLIIYLWIHRSIFPISHLLSFILLLSFSLLAYIFYCFLHLTFFLSVFLWMATRAWEVRAVKE